MPGVLSTFICSFIHSVFTECLPCTQHWGHSHIRGCQNRCLVELVFSGEDVVLVGGGGGTRPSKWINRLSDGDKHCGEK